MLLPKEYISYHQHSDDKRGKYKSGKKDASQTLWLYNLIVHILLWVNINLNFALASAYEMLSVEEESMVIMSHVDLEDLTCCRLLGQCAVSVKECWPYFSSHSSH